MKEAAQIKESWGGRFMLQTVIIFTRQSDQSMGKLLTLLQDQDYESEDIFLKE